MLFSRSFNHFTLIAAPAKAIDFVGGVYARQPSLHAVRWLASFLSPFTKTTFGSRETVLTLLVYAECPSASHLPSLSFQATKMQEDRNARGLGRDAAASQPDS